MTTGEINGVALRGHKTAMALSSLRSVLSASTSLTHCIKPHSMYRVGTPNLSAPDEVLKSIEGINLAVENGFSSGGDKATPTDD